MNLTSGNSPQPKLLIVDDEVDMCNMLTSLLGRRNFVVEAVNSLSEAVPSIRQNKPHVVFLDNCLPDGNGVDFIPFIKKQFPGIKVVLITAFDSTQEVRKAYDQGADWFIGKPFDAHTLHAVLDKLSLS